MVWPSNNTQMRDMIISNMVRIEKLEQHRIECDNQHEINKEHRKRSDDAMNNLTDSNLRLATALNEFNVTISRLTADVEQGKPVVEFWHKASTAWTFNKMMWTGIISVIAGIIVIITLYNLL